MLIKKSQLMMGLALAASIGTYAVAPTQAQEIPADVSALYGHKFLKEIKTDTPEVVAVGRVVGKAGSILSIVLMEPTSVSIDGQDVSTLTLDAYNWNTQLGSDVFLYYDDGAWGYLEDGTGNEMSWITRLKLKAVSDVQVSKIDWSETSAVSLPAVETRSAPAPAMAKPAMAEPTSGPVRGLW